MRAIEWNTIAVGRFAERNSRGLKKKELELDTRYWYSTRLKATEQSKR